MWDLLLVPAGFIAGVMNTIAGGGSFLTLPALMYVAGLDAQIANGTNRVAILLSTASATATFHKGGHVDADLVRRLAIPTLLGVPVGALLAVHLSPDSFRRVFGVLFLAMAAIIAAQPRLLLEARRPRAHRRWSEAALFLAIGVYIGFIQAGMGILLLLGMAWFHGRKLLAANAVKNALGLLVTVAALSVFVYYGRVEWRPGLIMAVGNLAGGYFGARLAISRGERLIFALLLVVMVFTGLRLLW